MRRASPTTATALVVLTMVATAGACAAAPRPAARPTARPTARPAARAAQRAAVRAVTAPSRAAAPAAPLVPTIEILQPAADTHAFRGSSYIIRWRCPNGGADTVRVVIAWQSDEGPRRELWSCVVPNVGSAKIRIPADLELGPGPDYNHRLGLVQDYPTNSWGDAAACFQVLRLH